MNLLNDFGLLPGRQLGFSILGELQKLFGGVNVLVEDPFAVRSVHNLPSSVELLDLFLSELAIQHSEVGNNVPLVVLVEHVVQTDVIRPVVVASLSVTREDKVANQH